MKPNLDSLTPTSSVLDPVPFEKLAEKHSRLREPVVDGLFRIGETVGIHAKSKVGKSWFAYQLMLSIISGRKLFGRFSCRRGRVLLVDNELHPENLVDRIPLVAHAAGLAPGDWRGCVDILSLRGRLKSINDLVPTFEAYGRDRYQFVLIDALYRILPEGVSENDNAQMADVFNTLDRIAAGMNSAIGFIHHASKGSQTDKDVVDIGSGAGSIARAVDSHLVLRPHQEQGVVVLEAALRSFPPIKPVALRWNFPTWDMADGIDVTLLKGSRRGKEAVDRQARRSDKEKKVREFLSKHGPATKSKIKNRCGISHKLDEVLDAMVESGDIVPCGVTSGNNRKEYEGYRLASDSDDFDSDGRIVSDTSSSDP